MSQPQMSLWNLMRSDVRAMVVDRGGGPLLYALSVALKLLLFPRLQAVLLFRLSHALLQARLSPLAYWLQAVALCIAGAEIHPAASIGPGFCLVHSNGVVIGDRARIGAHFICFHGVTVGDSGKGDGQPTIGDWVRASAGAKILGGIEIGDHAVIGANSVVLCDVPARGVAVGIPARIAKVRGENEDEGRND
jgi:serine O-acetyltransferase